MEMERTIYLEGCSLEIGMQVKPIFILQFCKLNGFKP